MNNPPVGIVVGASGEALHALARARALGIYTIAVDGDPHAAGLAAADRSLVTDIRDPQNIIAALGDTRPDVVIPVPIGRYLISGAALNAYYGLPGVLPQAAERCTDKWLFHTLLSPAGLRPADCRLLHAPQDFADARQFPLPAILKPRTGSGSRGVRLLQKAADLYQALADCADSGEDYLIETAVGGQEYGMDAAMIQGEFFPVLLRKKINTPPPYCQCVGYYAQPADTPLFAQAAALVKRAAAVLGIDNAVLHADLICSARGFFPIELSARPSGHSLYSCFTPLTTGIDTVENYLRFALHIPYTFTPKRHQQALIRFFDFSGCRILAVPDPDVLRAHYPLAAYECALHPGDVLDTVCNGSVMHRGYFVLTGCDEAGLTAQADAILSSFVREDVV